MKLKNKVIVVTGGGNGMGREIVLVLLEKGCKVVALDINEKALEATVKLADSQVESLMTVIADITNKEAIERVAEQVLGRFGAIDGIINNAGIIQPFCRVNDLDFEVINRIFNINFFGSMNMIKVFLPHLLNRPEAHIVNVSSMGGFLPVTGQSVYGASKAALKMLSEGLAAELSETQVSVTTVFPGAMATNIKANSGLSSDARIEEDRKSKKDKMALPPATAAQIIVTAIEKNKSRLYVGRDSKMLNMLYKFMPKVAVWLIYQMMKDKI